MKKRNIININYKSLLENKQREIMRVAHLIAKTLTGHYHARMSYALKQANFKAKMAINYNKPMGLAMVEKTKKVSYKVEKYTTAMIYGTRPAGRAGVRASY